MNDSTGYRLWMPNLGERRGALSDWITQQWVQLTGQSVDLANCQWLAGPVGDVDLIGSSFFHRLAEKERLDFVSEGPGRGLIDNFSRLRGPECEPEKVDTRVVEFYENTAQYEFDVWSEWSGVFRPLGGALAAIFSRRLQQLNVPLSPLETRLGVTSEVIQLKNPSGGVTYTAWVRDIVSTNRTLYAGAYSVCRVPGYMGPCVKVVFPLPNGGATVIMRPKSNPDGSFTVRSAGSQFGDPGFYFFVQRTSGEGWARYVRTLQETIHVYCGPRGILRADHTLKIWGVEFLRLHYRMHRRGAV
jgi:hypothetical protein